MQMLFMNIHVAQSVNGDKTTHDGDDDNHDKRKAVGRKSRDGGCSVRENELQVKQAHQLQCRHAHDRSAAEFPAQSQNIEQQQQIKHAEQAVQRYATK